MMYFPKVWPLRYRTDRALLHLILAPSSSFKSAWAIIFNLISLSESALSIESRSFSSRSSTKGSGTLSAISLSYLGSGNKTISIARWVTRKHLLSSDGAGISHFFDWVSTIFFGWLYLFVNCRFNSLCRGFIKVFLGRWFVDLCFAWSSYGLLFASCFLIDLVFRQLHVLKYSLYSGLLYAGYWLVLRPNSYSKINKT